MDIKLNFEFNIEQLIFSIKELNSFFYDIVFKIEILNIE